MRLKAFAKVNYALEVLGLRQDGYHEIRTVMQSISLADEIKLERAPKGFELDVEPAGTDVGPPEKNTVFLAWKALGEATGKDLSARIRLYKRIPAGAGLAGGSADAAAVIVGLNELYGLGLSEKELRSVGERVGADVPFCVVGGTALGEGIGEALTVLPAVPDHHLLLVRPRKTASTAEVYRRHDKDPIACPPSVEPALEALRARELPSLARSLGNDLSPITHELVPEVAALEKEMLKAGASGAAMTGSGTAVYGIFEREEQALAAAAHLRTSAVGVYRPVPRGVEVSR